MSPFIFLKDCVNENIPMCIVGNKVDLREGRPAESCVSSSDGEKLAKVSAAFSTQMIILYRCSASEISV